MKISIPNPPSWSSFSPIARYFAALISVALAVVLARVVEFHWHFGQVEPLLFLAVIFSAWFGGYRPCLVAIVFSVLAFYYFAPLDNAFAARWAEFADALIFGLLALLIGVLATAQRKAAESLRKTPDEFGVKVEELKRTNTLMQEEVTERKRVEVELRRSEAFLAQAQRVTKTSSLWWKVTTGEIFWSAESYRLMEYDPSITPTLDLIMNRCHPDDLALVQETVSRAAREGTNIDFKHRLRMPGGQIKHVHVIAQKVDLPSGALEFVGAVIDITEQKRVEDELRRSEAYLAQAQTLTLTCSFRWKVSTGEIYWSEENYHLLGYDQTVKPSLEAIMDRCHPDDRTFVRETLDRSARSGVDLDFKHRLLLPGGTIKYIRVMAKKGGLDTTDFEFLGAVADITEQHRTQVALEVALAQVQKSEDQLRTIIDTIPSLAWSTPEDGCADFLNKRWLDYTGLSMEEAQGEGWATVIHPDDIGMLSDRWDKMRASKKAGEVEARMRRYDGKYRWFLFRGAPLIDEQGKDFRWYGTNTDIDDLKRTEIELNKAQAELAHITRMTTMGELAASIAHEVKQPLTAVVNNATACISLLLGSGPNLLDVREALEEIVEDANRASSVMTRVRELARKAEIEKTLLNLENVVTEAIALARYESGTRRVTINSELPGELPLVLGDRIQFQQVLLNLLLNGMDAMRAVEPSERILVVGGHCEVRDEKKEVWISVKDRGVGIKPDEAAHLFEAFYTTKAQGMGMGLTISRSIIEAHGGRLWFEDNKGPGTTFLFSLPAASGTAP